MSSYSPELITSCKETQLTRLQCRVEQLATQPRRHSLKIINLCLLVSCIFSGIVGLAYLAFDPLVRSLILKKMVLSTSSENFKMWEDPPINPHLKVYFFNLTNAEAVFKGLEKPKLVEVGPYTYTQKWTKQNITWHENGTLSYRTRKIFTFNESLSCGSCNDKRDEVTTLNVPALSAYYKVRNQGYTTQKGVDWLIWGLGYKPWLTRKVHELMWGYDEPLFHAAKLTEEAPPFTDFALFLKKNSSLEEDLPMYTMYTGEGDPYKLATIQSFNGVEEMDHWNASECNKVHGSDGAAFNPYIKPSETLWFFNDQLCRAMPLVWAQNVEHKGLPGLRFEPREDVFMSSTNHTQNSCFAGPEYEVGNGVFDVRVCQYDTPIVLSWPHFLHAEAKYQDAVDGLKPDKNIHGFWFDIQQVTGTTLSAKARIQINMSVKKMEAFEALSSIKDTLIPILWFEEGIDELGDDIIDVLKGAAIEPEHWHQYILYCLMGLVSTMAILCLVALGKLLANRASVARVERVRQILGGQLGTAGTWADKLGTAGTWGHAAGQLPDKESSAQLTQPMLAGYLDSSESSRSSTATHSRNSSEGATPPYAVLSNNLGANNQREVLPGNHANNHQRGQNQVQLEPSGPSDQLASV